MEASLHRFRIAKAKAKATPLKHTLRADGADDDERERRSSQQVVCERCRRLKKKCSRNKPLCDQCKKAGVVCSFGGHANVSKAPPPPSDSPLPSSVAELQARVIWLSKRLDEAVTVRAREQEDQQLLHSPSQSPRVTAISMTPCPTAMPSLAQHVAHEEQPAVSTQLLSMATPEFRCISDVKSPEGLQPYRSNSINTGDFSPDVTSSTSTVRDTQPSGNNIPHSASAAIQFADAYFRHVHRVYPFMDRAQVMEELKDIYNPLNAQLIQMPVKLYLIMAIGCTTLRRVERVSEDAFARFKVSYYAILGDCLSKTDAETVETLMLLVLYSLFNPTDIRPWVICSILARQVISLGLGRKPSADLSPVIVERRRRLFWSAFSIDRLIAVSTGMPFCINDEKTNIALPSLTHTEVGSIARDYYSRVLQVNRHLILLRQLEEKVLHTIHLSTRYRAEHLTSSDRRIMIDEFRTQSENWYMQGCLLMPYETDQMPYHITTSWLSHRLQGLLLMMYTPSHFNCQISSDQLFELQSCMQKYVQISSVLQKQRQLALNWITLSSTIGISSVLLYCLVRQSGASNPFKVEATICAGILDSYSEKWHDAKRGSRLFHRLAAITHPSDVVTSGSAFFLGVSDHSNHATIFTDVQALLRDVMGESSLWYGVMTALADIIKEKERVNLTYPSQNPSRPPLIDEAWMVNDEELWTGYGNLGLEFA